MSSIDPTGAGNTDYPGFSLRPLPGANQPLGNPSSSLPGDVQSSNRGEQSALYPTGGWQADLLSIVNGQGSLASNNVPAVDLSPFLALIEQSSSGTAKPADVDSDFKSFLQSEEQKSQSSSGGVSSSAFDADFNSFFQSEEQKYQPPTQD